MFIIMCSFIERNIVTFLIQDYFFSVMNEITIENISSVYSSNSFSFLSLKLPLNILKKTGEATLKTSLCALIGFWASCPMKVTSEFS